jgi:hypothetical protein
MEMNPGRRISSDARACQLDRLGYWATNLKGPARPPGRSADGPWPSGPYSGPEFFSGLCGLLAGLANLVPLQVSGIAPAELRLADRVTRQSGLCQLSSLLRATFL